MNAQEISEIKNLIGTDISIEECIESNYTIIDTENKPFTIDTEYRIMEFCPGYLLKEMGYNEEEIEKLDRFEFMLTDTKLSFNELVEIYNDNKSGLDSCCETNIHVDFKEPDIYDFLNLASDCISHCGLK